MSEAPSVGTVIQLMRNLSLRTGRMKTVQGRGPLTQLGPVLASKAVLTLHLKTKFLAVTYSCDCCDPSGQEGSWLVMVPS